MMGMPFRRRESSPRTPDYNSGNSSPGRTSPLLPAWKMSKKRPNFDSRKMRQLGGVLLGIIVLFWVLSSVYKKPETGMVDMPDARSPNTDHLIEFDGALECRLRSQDLYTPPKHDSAKARKAYPYCQNRKDLNRACSNGGRHGFDVPYFPAGCHYKWYSTLEICMILDRFDYVVFIGDDLIESIYAAFNMLLRRDIMSGALQEWRLTDAEREGCRCDFQLTKPECGKYYVTNSDEVVKAYDEHPPKSPYACNRAPHVYYPVSNSPAAEATQKFNNILSEDPHSWKPVAMIHSLGLSTTFNWQVATVSMDEWLTVADASGRNTPFLWVGPNAAGHLKPPSKIMQEGNNALWHYTLNMEKEAQRRDVDAMNFYNMTLQAYSHDGSGYGIKVALAQAMMVVNWLARLETT